MNVKVDKTLAASIALHVLVIGWGLVSFSTKAFESMPEESLPVDIISADQLSKITSGLKSGKKEDPKQRVEKVAEAKPTEDTVGKITEKAPVVTDTAPPPQPKPEDKPVEKKPDPPKPVVENKPKEEPKPVEKKPDPPKVDPIAEALKKEEKKPPPKPVAQAVTPPQPPRPKAERTFDQSKIAALLDKRDPTRQAIAGSSLSDANKLGAFNRSDADNSASWKAALSRRIRDCFNFPYNGIDADTYQADIDIQIRLDGTIAAQPVVQAARGSSPDIAKAMAENAARAIFQCQPYSFLPKEQYASWKFVPMTFNLVEMR